MVGSQLLRRYIPNSIPGNITYNELRGCWAGLSPSHRSFQEGSQVTSLSHSQAIAGESGTLGGGERRDARCLLH